jgi:hypothetical protein
MLALCLATNAVPVEAQVPRLLHYQATLTDGRFPVDEAVDLEVAFFAEAEGGAPLAGWSEVYPDQGLSSGRVSLLLGSQTPLPDGLFDAPRLYLQLTVNDTAFPRIPVASTAFALRAGRAEAVVDGGVSAAAVADGAVTSAALADGSVTEKALATGSVTTATVADNAITGQKISAGAVGTSHLADGAVTSDKLGTRAVPGSVLADGAVTTDKLANGAVTASKVATGQLLTGLNDLTDAVRLVGGENVTVSSNASAGTITIDVPSLEAESDQLSSRRWKTDVRPIEDAMALVQQLRGVRYRWTVSGDPDVGFIAEEVGTVVPEVVTYAPNGRDAETVNYARLVALLVEAIKTQQAQIEADRELLHDLQTRLQALERE